MYKSIFDLDGDGVLSPGEQALEFMVMTELLEEENGEEVIEG